MLEKIEINIPILKNANYVSQSWINSESVVLNDLIKNSGKISILTMNLEIIKPAFYFKHSDELNKPQLMLKHKLSGIGREYHLLTLNFDYNSKWIEELLTESMEKSGSNNINYANRINVISVVEEVIDQIIYSLFIMFTLADPGAITFDNSVPQSKPWFKLLKKGTPANESPTSAHV